jgi:hypothetical protein
MGARSRGGRALCAYPSPQCVTLREALHGAPSGLARAFVQGCVGRDAAFVRKKYFAFNQLLTKRTFTNLHLIEVPKNGCGIFALSIDDNASFGCSR